MDFSQLVLKCRSGRNMVNKEDRSNETTPLVINTILEKTIQEARVKESVIDFNLLTCSQVCSMNIFDVKEFRYQRKLPSNRVFMLLL